MISEVEITWMLMPLSASVWNICWATPAWLRMPTPMTEILTTFESGFSAAKPSQRAAFLEHRHGAVEIGCARR